MHKLKLICPLTQQIHIHKPCARARLPSTRPSCSFASGLSPQRTLSKRTKGNSAPAAQHVLLHAFELAPGSVSVFQVLNCVLLQLLHGGVLVNMALCLDLRLI